MQLKNEIEYSIYSCVSVLQLTKKKPGIFSAEGFQNTPCDSPIGNPGIITIRKVEEVSVLLFTLMMKLLLSNQILCSNICLYVLDIPEGSSNNQNSQETALKASVNKGKEPEYR